MAEINNVAVKNQHIDFELYESLLETVYEATLDNTQWPVFLEKLTDVTNVACSTIWLTSDQGGFFYGHNLNPESLARYQAYYVHIDPFIECMKRRNVGQVGLTHEDVSDNVLRSTEFFNDFFKDEDVRYGISGLVYKQDNNMLNISLGRPERGGVFSKKEVNLLKVLIPHIRRAYTISNQLHQSQLQQSITESALNNLSVAVILVDKHGKPLLINQKAENLLMGSDVLTVKGGELTATNVKIQHKLLELIKKASQRELVRAGGLKIAREPDQSELTLLITPIYALNTPLADYTSEPAAMILISESEQNIRLPSEVLSSLYGLTRAEIRLVEELVQGITLEQIAEKYQISKHTLRVQIKSVFRKTGVNRQLDLVKLVLTELGHIYQPK